MSYEKGLAEAYVEGLRQRGHKLDEIDSGGITQARRAWLTKSDVINTWSMGEVKKWRGN